VPTYQYSCTDCGHFFEIFQSFSDDSLVLCPECEGRLRKVFNAVGVVFKGSGFYRNDSRPAEASGTGSDSGRDSGGDKGGDKTGSDKGRDKGGDKGGDKGSDTRGEKGSDRGSKKPDRTSPSSTKSDGSSGSTRAPAATT